ncbi:MAG TPA: nucleotidyl transferase AbiEii/AbiGii toxin family protein [Solirubrobacterales bacterium]|nr:nucleotidyl transferase AbiEii/AbiGii toxin family protein [Solirubrobacterales bacterium]
MDPARYVLKGGASLRYFFASERYSEDIDLDLIRPVPWNLERQVDAALTSPALRSLLAIGGLSLAEFTSAKQTETTRRWKVGIEAPRDSVLIRSKIEFSNREGGGDYSLASLPQAVVEPYALRPPSVQHYDAATAVQQKVAALAGRAQVQARDVFDLELLLRQQPLSKGSIDATLLDAAVGRALEQDYAAFRDQVLPFLEPGAAELIASESAWEQIQTFVADRLEAAR